MKVQLLTGIALAIGLLFLLPSCCDHDDDELEITELVTLSWQGNIAADGCGYFVKTDNKTYKPQNEEDIPDKFMIDRDTVIEMSYIDLGQDITFFCGLAIDTLPALKVLDIQ